MESKSPFFSKTVQGAVVALLAALAPPILAQLGIADEAVQNEIWVKAVEAVALAYAIYGRFAARTVLK